jgi:hypothetical protein
MPLKAMVAMKFDSLRGVSNFRRLRATASSSGSTFPSSSTNLPG